MKELQLDYISIELGKVSLAREPGPEELRKFSNALQHYELGLMDNKKRILVERIKILFREVFHSSDEDVPVKFSEYLSQHLHLEYTYLANIFSETEGSTIEKYFIETKIERVKQLLVYESLSIKQIAFQLNYSSVAHLCQQFKKVTGQTPSQYKKAFERERIFFSHQK